jgi:hypothetical protein
MSAVVVGQLTLYLSGVVLDGIGKQSIGFARKSPRDAEN